MNQLRQQITEESVAQQRMAAEMAQIRADVDESVGRNRICQQKCNDVTSEVKEHAIKDHNSFLISNSTILLYYILHIILYGAIIFYE